MSSPGTIDPSSLSDRVENLPGITRLREAARGTAAYLVGGVVRDLLLGRPRTDLDLVVEGDASELAAALGGRVREHQRFGTATVELDGLSVDLAAARAEEYPRPGALPEVRPATLSDDLARRDFTINAMAVPLSGPVELIDPHGGFDDLRAGRLRVLHPGSFRDDPTRAWRAGRYAARLDLSLEEETERLLPEADLGTVSADRIAAEMRAAAAEESAARAFALASEWGLIDLSPEVLELIGELRALLAVPPWSDLAAPAEAIVAAASGLEPPAALLDANPERPSQGFALARGRSGVELALARAAGAEWLDRHAAEWRHARLEIDGRDLIEAGVPEGPAVGRGLDAALLAKLDGEVAGRERELEAALRAARS